MEFRVLTTADASAVADLWLPGARESAAVNSVFQPSASVAQYSASLTQELSSQAIAGWGAFSEGVLLGYLTARVSDADPAFVSGKYLYLLDLDVRSDARRQGIASALVRMARSFAADGGISSIEVSWLVQDANAAAFWRSQGFSQYLARGRVLVGVAR